MKVCFLPIVSLERTRSGRYHHVVAFPIRQLLAMHAPHAAYFSYLDGALLQMGHCGPNAFSGLDGAWPLLGHCGPNTGDTVFHQYFFTALADCHSVFQYVRVIGPVHARMSITDLMIAEST